MAGCVEVERKLTTVLSADVVGFSRLVGEDEETTLGRLKAYRGVVEALVLEHGGRIFGSAGDSMVAEFPSPVEAVRCAAAIQASLARRNADLFENRRMLFRIGINLGDVVVEGDDLLGDGVNIAARLEALAEPGGVCISATVHDQVVHKVDLEFEALGPQRLKNIAEPVTAFHIALEDSPAQVRNQQTSGGWRKPTIFGAVAVTVMMAAAALWLIWPHSGSLGVRTGDVRTSIIVLPFDNLSGDPDEDHISDGIGEDLTTDLSRIRSLFVYSRNVAGEMKPRIAPGRRESVDPMKIARELGADYVLEGSVRRSGTKLRINAQLIDGKTGGHLWADRFDRESKDVFAMMDEVVLRIVNALKVTLTPGERKALESADTVDPDAWDLVLRGVVELRRHTRESNLEAEKLFRRAVEFDPNYARAYANVAFTLSIRLVFGWTDSADAVIGEALQFAEKARAIDDSIEQVHMAFNNIYLRMGDLGKAIESGRRMIEINPGNPEGHVALGATLNFAGRHIECLAALQEALRLDPKGPFFYIWIEGKCLFMLERYEEALERFERVAEQNPAFVAGLKFLAATQATVGRVDDAAWTVEEIMLLQPSSSLAKERRLQGYSQNRDMERYIDGLRLAGIPE